MTTHYLMQSLSILPTFIFTIENAAASHQIHLEKMGETFTASAVHYTLKMAIHRPLPRASTISRGYPQAMSNYYRLFNFFTDQTLSLIHI